MTEQPPHDLDAERAVLGALLSGALMADVQPLASADFWRPAHQLIYEAITSLTRDGKPAEPVAVADELRRRGDLTRMGGAPYLHTCMAATPSAANAGHYAGIVREYSQRRQWIEWAVRIQQAAHAPDEALAAVNELAVRPPAGGSTAAAPGRKLILTRASEIEIEPVVWAWEDDGQGRIPAGSLGLFAGREGTGKSSFLIWLTATDHHGRTARNRSRASRAASSTSRSRTRGSTRSCPGSSRPGRTSTSCTAPRFSSVEGETVSLSLPADNKLLEEAITGNDVALVALDPLMSAISDTLDTHVNRQVRQALDPLARLADRTGAVVAGIAHFNKSVSTDASSLITASGAFKDVARFIFAFADDQDGSKVITQTKNSLGLSNLPSLAYRLINATVPTRKGDTNVGRLILDGPSERTVQDILRVQAGNEPAEKTRADDYLRKALGDGPRRTKEVEEEAREVHGISKRTLDRARRDLRIPSAKGRPDGGSRCRSTRATSKRPPHPIYLRRQPRMPTLARLATLPRMPTHPLREMLARLASLTTTAAPRRSPAGQPGSIGEAASQ